MTKDIKKIHRKEVECMLKFLEKQIDGNYFYKGEKAEYLAECDELGNCFLTVNNHETIENGTRSLHEWLEGAEACIERIETGKKVLL